CLEHPWLVGEKKKAPPAPQPVAVRAVTPRAPFDLRELLRLQVSLGRSLEVACLACRSQHPELAASIRETIMQAQLLWQQAVKVIGQYAQVSRKVIETVLPDLNLAVQESTPELGYDLLSMVESWIQKMTADSEKMHWLCSELSKHLEKMITQAQAQQLQLKNAAPEARAAPPAPNAICDAAGQAPPSRRQDLFDELEVFANKISRGNYSDENEGGQSRDLVDLLFLSPGFGPGALKALEAPAETGEGSRELPERKSHGGDPTPTAAIPESLSPEPSSSGPASHEPMTDPNEFALCTTGGEVNRYPDYSSTPYLPLLRALYQLRSVSSILQECTAFWGHIESTVQELARTKDHTQALLRHAAKSAGLKERFDQRLAEYGAFWATLLGLCEQYCQEVQPALNKMMVDVRNAEALGLPNGTASMLSKVADAKCTLATRSKGSAGLQTVSSMTSPNQSRLNTGYRKHHGKASISA
ncbi:fhkC, partial [Symbiodinium pilosum]